MEKEDAERVSAALKDEAACTEPEKAAKDCLSRIEKCNLAEQIEEIKRKLIDPALTAAAQKEQPDQPTEYKWTEMGWRSGEGFYAEEQDGPFASPNKCALGLSAP